MDCTKKCIFIFATLATINAQLLPPVVPPVPAAIPTSGFNYAVNDLAGNEHSHTQNQIGAAKTGQYKVALPDGRLQTVTYVADAAGYRAKVDYTPYVPGAATTSGDAQVAALASIPPTAPPAVAAAAASRFGPGAYGAAYNPMMMGMGGMFGNGMYNNMMGYSPYMYGGGMMGMGPYGRMGGFGGAMAYPIIGGMGVTSPFGSSFGYQTPFASVSQYNNAGMF